MARLRFLVTIFAYTNIFAAMLILILFVWNKINQSAPMSLPNAPEVDGSAPLPPDPPPKHVIIEGLRLINPVAGATDTSLHDSFDGARSNHRVHKAIDIMAPRNARVFAVTDGQVVKMHTSSLGGICLYQVDSDNKFVFYYAHFDHYAEGIKVGSKVKQGQVIGYVGDTGNAAPGSYHLHFALWFKNNPNDNNDGININPYFVLYKNIK